jgi:hypothetical protein
MRKTLTAVAAAAILALATFAAPQQAEARHGHVAAGVIGGLALGALLGAAAANNGYYYAPGPTYYYRPHCWWTSRRYWNGWRWHWRRVRVCD